MYNVNELPNAAPTIPNHIAQDKLTGIEISSINRLVKNSNRPKFITTSSVEISIPSSCNNAELYTRTTETASLNSEVKQI